MKFLELGWVAKSIISLIFVIPAWLSIDFLKKNFAISAEITMVGYFAGTSVGAASILMLSGVIPTAARDIAFFSVSKFLPPFMVGILLGALTNLFLFSAIPAAPNPGLPIAIQSSAIVFVFLLSALFSSLMPRFFDTVRMDFYHFLGILLIILGVAVIVSRR